MNWYYKINCRILRHVFTSACCVLSKKSLQEWQWAHDSTLPVAFLSCLLAPSCHRSDKQPAGHPDDPGSCHQGPGQRAEPAEGQSVKAGRREGVAAEPVPGPGGQTEPTAPVPGEGLCVKTVMVCSKTGCNQKKMCCLLHYWTFNLSLASCSLCHKCFY